MSLDDETPTQYHGPGGVTFTGTHGSLITVSQAHYYRLTEAGALTDEQMLNAKIDGRSLQDILDEANGVEAAPVNALGEPLTSPLGGKGTLVMPNPDGTETRIDLNEPVHETGAWTRNEADNAPYVAPTFRRSATADVKAAIGDNWPITDTLFDDKGEAEKLFKHPGLQRSYQPVGHSGVDYSYGFDPEDHAPLTWWERTPRFWQFITVYVAGGLTSSAGWLLADWILP
jgi:hypothetical protein